MKNLLKNKKATVILLLIILFIIDIPAFYMNYTAKTEQKLMSEQISEAIYTIPDYLTYIKPFAVEVVKNGETLNLENPTDLQSVLLRLKKESWHNFIDSIPEDQQNKILSLANKYKLL